MEKTEIRNRVYRFLNDLNSEFKDDNFKYEFIVNMGSKFAKIIRENNSQFSSGRSVWGFVALKEMNFKNEDVKPGDLFKAASFAAPAAISRGNIFNGTGLYDKWGPKYIDEIKPIIEMKKKLKML